MAHDAVLVLNCGSSSVKFALVDPASGHRWLGGLAERVGTPAARVHLRRSVPGEEEQRSTLTPDDPSLAGVLAHLLDADAGEGRPQVRGVGHRVVHGGERFTSSVVLTDEVLAEIRSLTDLAPLHIPANVAGVEAAAAALPGVVQVAVFDTSFHATLPPRAFRYAVPTSWYEEHGVRRYGFHGTSHRYVSARAAELLGRSPDQLRVVTLHLGNGASATAVRDGVSVDTSMGLTPLEGLVMGTRSGDLDPGVLGYVSERLGLDVRGVLDALNTRSGLLGLSGVSNDMREVADAAEAGSQAAALAREVFCYRLAKYVAALVVPLGRLDAVVFTGGVGENDAAVRASVLAQLGFLGLEEDAAANAAHGRGHDGRISAQGRAPVALVVPTDEELVIARDTLSLVGGSPGQPG